MKKYFAYFTKKERRYVEARGYKTSDPAVLLEEYWHRNTSLELSMEDMKIDGTKIKGNIKADRIKEI